MQLIKNVNVAAQLVNSATGMVVHVTFDNADCTALVAGKHPPPYCIVVEFAGFRGFLTKSGQRIPNQPQWVPVYREKFVAPRGVTFVDCKDTGAEGLLVSAVSAGSVSCHDLPKSTRADTFSLYSVGRSCIEQSGPSTAAGYLFHLERCMQQSSSVAGFVCQSHLF